MPEFTIELHQQCSSMEQHNFKEGGYEQSDLFYERRYPICTCPAYKFGKRVINFGGRMYPVECKHILRVQETTCTWHSAFGRSQEKDGVCPECGKETVVVRFAV